jgi:hypothetical protein
MARTGGARGEKRGDRARDFGQGHVLDAPKRGGGNPKGTRAAAAKARGAQGTKDKPIRSKKGGIHGAAKLARAQARRKRVAAKSHTAQGKQRRG